MNTIYNTYTIDGDVTTIICPFEEENYKILISSVHMTRMNEEVSSVTIRRIYTPSGNDKLTAFVNFRDDKTKLKYGIKSKAMPISRYLLNLKAWEPKGKTVMRVPMLKPINGVIDARDSNLEIKTPSQIIKESNNPGRPRGGGNRGIQVRDGGKNVGKMGKYYLAFIQNKGKQIYLGTFKTKEEALDARRQAELKYWGKIYD